MYCQCLRTQKIHTIMLLQKDAIVDLSHMCMCILLHVCCVTNGMSNKDKSHIACILYDKWKEPSKESELLHKHPMYCIHLPLAMCNKHVCPYQCQSQFAVKLFPHAQHVSLRAFYTTTEFCLLANSGINLLVISGVAPFNSTTQISRELD